MATIYLLKYNNYYNRQLKHINTEANAKLTLQDFINNGGVQVGSTISNYSFKWGDGIHNELILNYDCENLDTPDYCLIDDSNKSTVWFIMRMERTRQGQCKVQIYRDLVNTYYDQIISSPAFIEKAWINGDNDLIFNNENMSYNQIKDNEYLLTDISRCPWLVGYIASNHEALTNESFTIAQDDNNVVMTMTSSEWLEANNNKAVLERSSITYDVNYTTIGTRRTYRIINFGENVSVNTVDNSIAYSPYSCNYTDYNNIRSHIRLTIFGNKYTTLYNYAVTHANAKNETFLDELQAYTGLILKFTDNVAIKINSISVSSRVDTTRDHLTIDSLANELESTLEDYCSTNNIEISRGSNHPFYMNYSTSIYKINYEVVDISQNAYSYSIPQTVRGLIDAPYKMFAIPYTDVYIKNGNTQFTSDKAGALAWALDIAKKFSANLYDLQVLPYCPIDNVKMQLSPYKLLNVPILTSNVDYVLLSSGGNTKSICLFNVASTFTRKVNAKESLYSLNSKFIINDYKIENETQVFRLCSPNYSSVFEYSNAKNGGTTTFIVECTYKPYTPYICVHPQWGRLYNKDFRDNRGLICSDDFGLPIINDAFTTYELQNKNYMNTFNRQIENMNVNNSIANQQAAFGAISGVLQGTASGVISGGLKGGVAGAVVGGVIGAGASTIGAAMDITNMKKLQAETLDYSIDQFGYALGNIKALPYSLSKASSILANTKYFPFLEVYKASDVQVEALRKKIEYNGMTLGIIDNISNYLQDDEHYIKAKIIRLENADVDYNEANTIAEELNKGVYM